MFKVGDIVVLKSGGPNMGVNKVYDLVDHKGEVVESVVECVWHSEGGTPERVNFPPVCLYKVVYV